MAKSLYSLKTAAAMCGCSSRGFRRLTDRVGVEILNFGNGKTKRFFIKAGDIPTLMKAKKR